MLLYRRMPRPEFKITKKPVRKGRVYTVVPPYFTVIESSPASHRRPHFRRESCALGFANGALSGQAYGPPAADFQVAAPRSIRPPRQRRLSPVPAL